MIQKTERFEMRLDQATLDRVDAWRSGQDDLPSRAEAVRRLIETALQRSAASEAELAVSPAEKLMFALLCDIHKRLEIDDGVAPEFIQRALSSGHYWALRWQYPSMFQTRVDDEQTLHEVVDVLDMWDSIESSYERLSKDEKSKIQRDAVPFGKHVRFVGYDGNYETEQLGIAGFLVRDMNRFSKFRSRDLNSHAPMVDAYRRMLQVWRPLKGKLGRYDELGAALIVRLLKEMVHPDNRK